MNRETGTKDHICILKEIYTHIIKKASVPTKSNSILCYIPKLACNEFQKYSTTVIEFKISNSNVPRDHSGEGVLSKSNTGKKE